MQVQFTEREIRLVIQRRKGWHKLLRRSYYFISALSLLIICCVPVFMILSAQKKLAYQNSAGAIQAVTQLSNWPTFIIPASQYTRQPVLAMTEEARLAADYVEKVMWACDSLRFTSDKRLGFRCEIVAVPCGLFGKRHVGVRANVYSSFCGCDTDSLIDQTDFVLDSTGANVVVASSPRRVATASIQP